MGGLDAVVFTAGIGENSPTIRKMACEGLEFLGVDIDAAKNEKNQTNISRGRTPVLIVPTNEELAIAQEVVSVLEKHNKRVEA
jgi:acetate kinase